MTQQDRYQKIINFFEQQLPEPETELKYQNPYQLVVSVILSAQCTDKRVNKITPDLFNRFPTAKEMALVEPQEVFEYIKSCSYPNNKAKHLVGMARKLVNDFNNIVPKDLEDLQQLPGVGRKTANVVASVLFDKPVMPVDTHVFRVSARIGLTKGAKTPLAAEMQLVKNIPERLIPKAHHWLILHGRYVCVARKPKCLECGINSYCEYYNQNQILP
jgi:endonuclease-3